MSEALKEHPWIKLVNGFGGKSITDPELTKQRSIDFFKLSKSTPCDEYNPFSPFNWYGGQDPITKTYLPGIHVNHWTDFINRIQTLLNPPEYAPVRLKVKEFKKHVHTNVRYDAKEVYKSPYKDVSDTRFNEVVHHFARSILANDISEMYCGYFGWCGADKLPEAIGTTGCYGSAFTNYAYDADPRARLAAQYIHGDNLVGWKTLADQDYVGWLLDRKHSPYKNYLSNDIVVYNKDDQIRGHILLNCHAPAAVFASLGITIRALKTHSKQRVWTLLRNSGFTRPEAWILMHLITLKGDTDPLQFMTSDYNHVMYVGPQGRVNFANVFNKRPIIHKNVKAWNPNYTHSLEREIYERKGYNPCNAIWDNNKARAPNKHEKISRWFINEVATIVNKKVSAPTRTLGGNLGGNTDPHYLENAKAKTKDWTKENHDTLERIRGAMDKMRGVFKHEADDSE